MPGPNSFDDPRPNTRDRFLVRYAATSLRGSLLELLAAFRPNDEARALEDDVQGDTDLQPDPDSQLRQTLADFLADRQLAVMTPPARTRFMSIDDPGLQAELDREPGVRALLDGPDGRLALMPIGGARPRLDGAAVRPRPRRSHPDATTEPNAGHHERRSSPDPRWAAATSTAPRPDNQPPQRPRTWPTQNPWDRPHTSPTPGPARPHPRQDTTMLRRQPPLEQLPGLTVQPARHHRPRVHIQPETRTLTPHWGLPHLWLYRPGPPSPATHDYM